MRLKLTRRDTGLPLTIDPKAVLAVADDGEQGAQVFLVAVGPIAVRESHDEVVGQVTQLTA